VTGSAFETRVAQNRAPTRMSGNEGSCYTQTAKTSPHPGSVTQPVSAPMSRSRVFALRCRGEDRLRVSTRDQNPDAQRDALTAAGCDQIFVDKASGKLAHRPGLDKALLSASRAGDQLVVTKLDRLGRSLEHLIALSKDLQEHKVDLVVLDQGIDTSAVIRRTFSQIGH
jgi:hypothetical protein